MMELTLLGLVLSLLLQLEVTEGQRRVEGRKIHVFKGQGQDVLSSLPCEHHSQGYIVPDPYHCDRFLVCGSNGRREIRLCQDPEESFHLEQGFCWKREEEHCLETGRTRRWNIDTINLEIRLYQDLKSKRVPRSLSSHGHKDVLKEVQCEEDGEGYIVPDPHHCNRYLECDPLANGEVKLCKEGQSLNTQLGVCQDSKSVDCRDRTKRWKVLPKTKKIRLFQGLKKAPLVTTLSSTTTPLAAVIKTTTIPALENSVVHHDPLVEAQCEGDGVYVVPDPLHCDRYLLCPGHSVQLCDDGELLDTETGYCAPQDTVQCAGRTLNMRNIRKQLEARLEEKVKDIARETEEINLFLSTSTSTTTTRKPEVTTQKSSIRRFGTRLLEHSSPSTPVTKVETGVVPQPSSIRSFVFPNKQRTSALEKNSPMEKIEDVSSQQKTVPRPAGIKIVKNTFDINSSSVKRTPQKSVEEVDCKNTEVGYKVGDKDQCDRYVDCSPDGVKTISLCPDGLAFSISKSQCDYLTKVDCTSRPNLQQPKSTKLCPRENGYFPVAAEISCSQYVDCRNGIGHVTNCGAGAVFDEVSGCVHPDQTDRAGCSASEKYSFTCPSFGLYQRFGDHDRLPHPSDCSLFYACLRNGAPRLLSCQAPTVFNPESGFCEHQDKVPGCQGYYPETADLDRDKLTEEIREKLLEELGLSR